MLTPRRSHYRAVVVNTRVTDDPLADEVGTQYSVECDLLLIRSGSHAMNVPVLQRNHGINNVHDLWIPRPSTRVVSGNSALNLDRILSPRGTRVGPITAYDDVDGDHVLVSFVEGRRDYPVIVGALTHKKTNRIVIAGSGWTEATAAAKRGIPEKDEYFTHHKGAEIRINDDGEVLVDTVGAYTDASTETVTADKGQIRFRVKDELRFTIECDGEDVLEVYKEGGTVHVDIGEGATEHIVLGDAFKALYNAHTHLDPVTGSTGVTQVQMDAVPGTHLSLKHRVK
jgi:hypothetical protein